MVLAGLYRGLGHFVQLLVGMPSYEKYLEHHKKHHPHCTPLSRKEFFAQSQERRYGRDGAKKCC
ncbi:YbdD/YjiX family protein [Helicobacter mustelae]|uniref:YbdD/YjiX family protein n=1 Tax=Helicobacter mustelae TaxID=217 RepID=UPI0002ECC84E|nr:YbdD/YjiX family protein [Helicobacter mustelae]SQH71187.1 Uncharacterized small protein [Helicobacter mustelae]